MNTNEDIASWRVLVVDDEPDNLDLAADLLEFSGATVLRALGGQQALQVFDEYKPTIVLLDLAMPDIDGWTVYDQIRNRETCEKTVIIALTALAMPADAEKVRAAGFDGYVTKPFRVNTLLREIALCVKAHHERAALPTQDQHDDKR